RIFMKWKDKDTVTIHTPEAQNPDLRDWRSASLWLIRYKDIEIEKVDEGVNKGRVLRFSNVIQSIDHIAKWYGPARIIDVDVAAPEGGEMRGGYVVIAQELMG